jgi:hypothetical protein
VWANEIVALAREMPSIVPKKCIKRALRLHKLPEAQSFLVPDVVLIGNLTVKLHPLPATAPSPAPLNPSNTFGCLHDPPPRTPRLNLGLLFGDRSPFFAKGPLH